MNEAAVARAELPGADKGGAWVRMGDREWKVAPLNFKALRELSADVQRLASMERGKMPGAEEIAVLARVAHAALKRNYPDVTEDQVAEDLDFGNFGNVLGAVLGASSLTKREEPKPGEPTPSP